MTTKHQSIRDYTRQTMIFQLATHVPFFLTKQWRIQGEGPEAWTSPSPSPSPPDACLRLKFLHRQDRISLLNWLIFLMKRALHFATKLNSRDIQKCNRFLVPCYDLFASARKAVHGKGPRNYYVQPRLVWGCGVK